MFIFNSALIQFGGCACGLQKQTRESVLYTIEWVILSWEWIHKEHDIVWWNKKVWWKKDYRNLYLVMGHRIITKVWTSYLIINHTTRPAETTIIRKTRDREVAMVCHRPVSVNLDILNLSRNFHRSRSQSFLYYLSLPSSLLKKEKNFY